MRDDRQADAGSSHTGKPARRDCSRISSLVMPASSSGLRTPNSLRGGAAGTVVAAIVSIGAVGDTREAAIAREARQPRIELVFAEVAPVLGIRAVLGAIDFAGEDDLVLQVEVARDAQRQLAVVRRVTGAVGGDAERRSRRGRRLRPMPGRRCRHRR